MKINSEKNTRQFFNTGIYMHFQKLQRQGTKPTITGFTAAMQQSHVAILSEVESRTQGSRPRPRTQKNSEAKDSLSEDRHSRGQGQECSRPRTQVQVLPLPPKKRSPQKFFRRSPKKKGLHKNFSSDLPKKNVFHKIFQALYIILTIKKIVLSSSRGQANFRGLEAEAKDLTFEAKDFKICPRGLHLCIL